MAKQSIVEKVSARIDDIIAQRAQDLQTIESALATAKSQEEEASRAAEEATKKLNLPEYEKAKEALHKVKTAIEMYEARLLQARRFRYVDESESDRVIDDLLAYESELAEKYVADIKVPLAALAAIHEQYMQDVQNTEATIYRWTSEVHPNYRSATSIYAETGTNRSPNPIPVHQVPYTGCDESQRVDDFLHPYGHVPNAPTFLCCSLKSLPTL